MFWVTSLKILGRVGTHIFFIGFFFREKNIIIRILKGMFFFIEFIKIVIKVGPIL